MKFRKLIPIFLGILSALFFAVTFVLNRFMSVSGGHWIWSASFRFFWMLPLLLIVVGSQQKIKPLIREILKKPSKWMIWSTIGFGVFYLPLTFAASYAPSWLIACTWQITIVAGLILDTLSKGTFYHKNKQKKGYLFSGIILTGVFLTQIGQLEQISGSLLLISVLPVILAAFAYPLGNRKMMELTNGKLSGLQRTLGMTIASMPFWFVITIVGIFTAPQPTIVEVSQTFIVAIASGVIATTLFFMATDKVRTNKNRLAAVEATQATEVVFAFLGEVILLQIHMPDEYAIIGMLLICIGMVLHSIMS
ncbi:multidrug resistance efflux transporter family protein [Aquimarina sp. TRL1]|uniref:DMT family transporter n=1 Tax=Aquimarina sp. (strain TRL1) TaxID=2736252 RepID=UPI00158DEF9B|nr:multidrug resistance efflux transporter family protein [Aquimarina sp. TRL1]QKX06423.1 multidrug resistance efflux transporter family protein [Aquimarina sp. TRL1]